MKDILASKLNALLLESNVIFNILNNIWVFFDFFMNIWKFLDIFG